MMAGCSKFSNTAAVSILELLRDNVIFRVPRFQRNYSWDREKVTVLWNDIMENFIEYKNNPENIKNAQYLLGPIVLVQEEDKRSEFTIIDGQQRLATITIIFCAIRDIIRGYTKLRKTEVDSFGKIREMIEKTNMGKPIGQKLILNSTDEEFFEQIQNDINDENESKLVQIKDEKTDKVKSREYLKDNYQYLYKKIIHASFKNFEFESESSDKNIKNDMKLEQLDEKNDIKLEQLNEKNIRELIHFTSYIQEYNYVVKILVLDDDTAFQIFETLNDRGQSLSKSNLIKNYILKQIGKNDDLQRKLSKKWDDIFDMIIKQGQGDDDFIMESLRSRGYDGDCDGCYNLSMKNLYKIIKRKKIKTEQQCLKYIRELKSDADFLSKLNDPEQENDFTMGIKDDIRAMKVLNAKYIRAPILAAYREWENEENDYKKLIPLLVKFFFKYRIIRHMHPGNVECIMKEIVKKIRKKESFNDIEKLIKKYDDHKDFIHQFKRFASHPSSNASKYILRCISTYLGTKDTDVIPIKGLTLEHILPRNHEETWPKENFFVDGIGKDERMEDYVNHLGNLTLLKGRINSTIKNAKFETKKKEAYKESLLNINRKTVNNENEWTKKIIVEREKKFIEFANKIWNHDFTEKFIEDDE